MVVVELWHWRRLLRVPWTARRSNQSILKEIGPEYSLEGLMLKLKLQYLWPPDAKNWLISKDPDAGKDWGWEEKGTTEDEMVEWHHWLNGYEPGQTQGDIETGKPGMLQSMGSQRVGPDWAAELLLLMMMWWIFAACGFFLVAASGGSSLVVHGHRGGSSCCGAWALGCMDFSSCGTWAQ